MPTIKITETALRDAHQSLFATRMTIDEMLPILEKMDSVGYYALEMWGGATFDACLRYLNEDPWDRLRTIRKHIKNTKLQMLLRGQNLLGYKNYADDVVAEFVKRSVANGIDIVRIFDALNDTRNLRLALEVTKAEGAHAQAAIAYTISPAHTTEMYVSLAREMTEMGADSLCIKDMSGLLTPYYATELVTAIKSVTDLPLEVHSHATSGLASMMYLKAIEAGADIIDTAISPLSSGTSQPPTESLVATLSGSSYDTGLDLSALSKISAHFRPIREKYMANGLLNPKVLSVDINTLVSQVPGGMLSNLVSQLEQQGALDRYDDVLAEVPKVRADLGYPPLVTPTSQMVGTQAVLNVLTGQRYKMVPNEIKAYVKGMYGKPVLPINPEIARLIIGDDQPITCRPADLLASQLPTLKQEVAEFIESEEDILTYALFPKIALDFFKNRQAKQYQIDHEFGSLEEKTHYV